MSSVLDKIRKSSKVEGSAILADSKFFQNPEQVQTPVPMINVALSGSVDGGLSSGVTILAGPSKHFKTSFALLMASAYLDKHEDAALLFYDTEFGSPQAYFESFDISANRVVHTPVVNIEELKFDLIAQLENLDRGDKVVIVIDSIGNLASKKEIEDAINEKSVADMTRAKSLKGLFRMVTPYLKIKDIPLIGVNHTYKEQALYPKDIVSGGTGPMYSADNVWIIGRQQDKQGTEIQGYHFVIKVEKSRFVREGSKIPISVSWEGGIQRCSGLTEVAMDLGYVIKPKSGWYQAIDLVTGNPIEPKVRYKDTLTNEFWKPFLDNAKFRDSVRDRFSLESNHMINKPKVGESSQEQSLESTLTIQENNDDDNNNSEEE